MSQVISQPDIVGLDLISITYLSVIIPNIAKGCTRRNKTFNNSNQGTGLAAFNDDFSNTTFSLSSLHILNTYFLAWKIFTYLGMIVMCFDSAALPGVSVRFSVEMCTCWRAGSGAALKGQHLYSGVTRSVDDCVLCPASTCKQESDSTKKHKHNYESIKSTLIRGGHQQNVISC